MYKLCNLINTITDKHNTVILFAIRLVTLSFNSVGIAELPTLYDNLGLKTSLLIEDKGLLYMPIKQTDIFQMIKNLKLRIQKATNLKTRLKPNYLLEKINQLRIMQASI